MDWHKCSESFIHIVEQQSFAAAARKRFTSSSALSKQINWLEAQLGVQLLQRTTRHLELTDEGQHFYHQAKQLLEEWHHLQESCRNQSNQLHGVLNLGLSVILGNHYVMPLLPAFLTQHPHVKIQLTTLTYPLTTINLEHLDVYVSHKPPEAFSEHLDHRVLGTSHLHVFASPIYLKNHNPPHTPTDLKHHNCLLNAGSDHPHRWQFEQETINVQGNLIADNGGALVRAAVAGLGLLFTSPLVAAKEAKGSLETVMPAYRSPPWNTYAYFPKRKKLPLKTATFLDYIEENLQFNPSVHLAECCNASETWQ